MDSTAALKKTKRQPHESGFKLTPQREVTVLVLLENEKDHSSVGKIYFLVKQKNPEIGLATVYRTLEVSTDSGVIDKMSFNNGLARCDLRKGDAKHFHHHLLCLECDTIEEAEEGLLDEVEQIVESRYHLLVKDHRLTFYSICQSC